MCIKVRTKRKTPPEGIGYKELLVLKGRLAFNCYTRHPLVIGKWMKATDPIDGFHILLKSKCPTWHDNRLKVKYKEAQWKATDNGTHLGEQVVVAQKMFISVTEARKYLMTDPCIRKSRVEQIIERSRKAK